MAPPHREPRAGRRYQQFKAQVRTVHASCQAPCALCGAPINYRLRYPNKWAWSLDHRVAIHQGGAIYDPANCQPSHLHCNQSRGATEGNATRRVPTTSRRW